MRSLLAIMSALALFCGVALAQTQQGGSSGGTDQQQMTGQEQTVTATVDNVNQSQKMITVTGSSGNKMSYTLSNNTMIVSSTGKTMKVSDLKPGSKVTITYTGTAENPTVTKVQVQKGK